MINNPELYETMKALSEKAIPIYGKKVSDLSPPHNKQPFLSISLHHIDKDIEAIKEFSSCLNIAKKDAKFMELQGMLVGALGYRSIINNEKECIFSFLKLLFLENSNFDKAYYYFEHLFYSDSILIEESTRLYNFTYSGNKISLDAGLHIERSINDTLDDTLSLESRLNAINNHSWKSSEFVIVNIFEAKKIVSSSTAIKETKETKETNKNYIESSRSDFIFDNIISALRILKSSAVYRDHKIKSKTLTFHPGAGITTRSPLLHNTVVGKKCEFKAEEIAELKEIYKFINSEKESRFIVAQKRLTFGLERKSPEDSLIDYMIGLEALYLPDGNQELSFRLSLRIAFLLSTDTKDRKELFMFIKDIYKTRSSIVHGSKYELSADIVTRTEDILRASLKLWIKDKGNFTVNKFTNTGNLSTEGMLDNIFF